MSRRFYDIEDRLLLAFETKCTAAISEIGIVRNEVMGAVVATLGLIAWFCIHGSLERVQNWLFRGHYARIGLAGTAGFSALRTHSEIGRSGDRIFDLNFIGSIFSAYRHVF